MSRLILALVSGTSLAGIYALISLGLVLAFRATSTLNFAHGELMVIGAFFIARWENTKAAPGWIGFIVGAAVAGAICALFYLLVLRRLTGGDPFLSLIATFGLAGLLDAVIGIMFGPDSYTVSGSFLPHQVVSLGGARVTVASLILIGFTFVLALVVLAVMRYTPLGLRVRAAGQDPILASQGRIAVRRLYLGSWIVAAVLAVVAGVVYGIGNQVAPSMTAVALVAFPGILLGGLDSLEGAVLGSLIVGLVQGLVSAYLSGQYVTVVTWGLLLVVLLLRPQGLFGTKAIVRA